MNTNTQRLIKLSARPGGAAQVDHPRPERLIRGNPMRETWNEVDEALTAGQVFCGVWRCEPGHWRIAMGPTERELFTVLSGRCRVHDSRGGHEEIGPGEALYIPPGFEGSFEVLEALTKTYMICE
ncbi:MAG TPA: cupin domain-containing protein [Hydrogenophaga sp.]